MSDPAGIPFGSYRLIRRLALGGMAEVFLARQTGLEGFDRLCAVKRILPHLVASKEFVDMFQGEARLAAQLRHPNVVHIYEFGKVEEAYFIAMEYVDGVAAGRLIQHAGSEPLPFALVARIGASACAGLDHAHNLRDVEGNPLALVHRDVSPPNLLISYEGAIKLVDFGIAKAESSIEHTRPGVVKGKYAYMSPEQTTGDMLDGRSDVFSLGVVLWELLAGRPAVRRDDPLEGMKAIRDGKIDPIESVRTDTPPELARAIRAALAVNPDNRVSALELGLGLERFIKRSRGMSSNLELAQWIRDRFPRDQEADLAAPSGPTREATAATGHLGSLTALEEAIEAGASPTAEGSAPTWEGAARTEISAPLFPDGSPLSGPTEIAIGLESPAPRPRSSRALFAVAAVGLLAAVGFTAFALGGGDGDRNNNNNSSPSTSATPTIAPAVLEVLPSPRDATVTVEGRQISGATELPPGTYQVAISMEGKTTQVRTVELVAGERRTLELSLAGIEPANQNTPPASSTDTEDVVATAPAVEKTSKSDKPRRPDRKAAAKAPGTLRARSIPYAEVYLKGRKLGVTPLSVSLPAGKHRLRFVNPKSKRQKIKLVTIRPSATAAVSIKLD